MQSFKDHIFKNLDTASWGWWMTTLHEVQQKNMTVFSFAVYKVIEKVLFATGLFLFICFARGRDA